MIVAVDRRSRYRGGLDALIGPSYERAWVGVASQAGGGATARRGHYARGRTRLRGRRLWWLLAFVEWWV